MGPLESPACWVLLVALSYGPLLAEFFFKLWSFKIHQFFPLALAGSGLLAWRGLREWDHGHSGADPVEFPATSGRSLTILSLLLLTAATLLWSPWLAMISLLAGLAGAAFHRGGMALIRSVLPAWLMLLTLLPPPFRLEGRFALALQHWAVEGSSWVLTMLAVPNDRSGYIILIPGRRLLVEEACSGVNSILLMSAACVFLVLWRRRSLRFFLLLYAVTVAGILGGNILRISLGGWMLFDFGFDLFVGTIHEMLGLILTLAYLALIVASDSLLLGLTHRHPRFAALLGMRGVSTISSSHAEEGLASSPVSLRCVAGRSSVIVASLLLVLGGLQYFEVWKRHDLREREAGIDLGRIAGETRFILPDEIAGWTRITAESPLPVKTDYEQGVFSHIWRYERGELTATVSLDYPFLDYHDIRLCYVGSGWAIVDTRVRKDSAGIPEMVNSLGRDGITGDLLYSTVDQTGTWLDDSGERSPYDPQGNSLEGGAWTQLLYRLRQLPLLKGGHPSLNCRIQLLSVSPRSPSPAEKERLLSLFHGARALLTQQFLKNPAESRGGTVARLFVTDISGKK